MPEFILDKEHRDDMPEFKSLPEFVQGYIECMFFTDTDEDDDGCSIKPDSGYYQLSKDALDQILSDCNAFFERPGVPEAIGDKSLVIAGHDFWYTRNGHGCGYLDRDGYADRDLLDEAAKTFGECYPCTGDDGLVYID